MPLLVAMLTLGLIILGAYLLIKRAENMPPVKCTLSAPKCPRCGTVRRVWGEPGSNEPTWRTCDCISPRTVDWATWANHCDMLREEMESQ